MLRRFAGPSAPLHMRVLSQDPTAYWPMWETAGSVAACLVNPAQNGTYTGVTLDNIKSIAGMPAPLFDGAEDILNVYSTTFNTAFPRTEGSISVWGKVYSETIWPDDANRYLNRFRVSGTDSVHALKPDANDQMRARYEGNNDISQQEIDTTTLNWFSFIYTWSIIGDKFDTYFNTVKKTPTVTGLDTFSGNFNSDQVTIGGFNVAAPTTLWHGWISDFAVFPTPLTQAQVNLIGAP